MMYFKTRRIRMIFEPILIQKYCPSPFSLRDLVAQFSVLSSLYWNFIMTLFFKMGAGSQTLPIQKDYNLLD